MLVIALLSLVAGVILLCLSEPQTQYALYKEVGKGIIYGTIAIMCLLVVMERVSSIIYILSNWNGLEMDAVLNITTLIILLIGFSFCLKKCMNNFVNVQYDKKNDLLKIKGTIIDYSLSQSPPFNRYMNKKQKQKIKTFIRNYYLIKSWVVCDTDEGVKRFYITDDDARFCKNNLGKSIILYIYPKSKIVANVDYPFMQKK